MTPYHLIKGHCYKFEFSDGLKDYYTIARVMNITKCEVYLTDIKSSDKSRMLKYWGLTKSAPYCDIIEEYTREKFPEYFL